MFQFAGILIEGTLDAKGESNNWDASFAGLNRVGTCTSHTCGFREVYIYSCYLALHYVFRCDRSQLKQLSSRQCTNLVNLEDM